MSDEGENTGHDSSERWLVSYADFITLLFALFVLLYALSMQSTDRVNRAWEAMATAVGVRPHRGGIRPELGEAGKGRTGVGAAQAQLAMVMKDVRFALRNFPKSGITLTLDEHGLVLSLSAARFFASGDAEIASGQLPVLVAVAHTLESLKNRMEIDGFTDTVPIHNQRYDDNWELSANRAASVLRFLLGHSAIDPEHLTIAGYGPYRAIADNGTEAGRAANRRVEIVVRPLGIGDDWMAGQSHGG